MLVLVGWVLVAGAGRADAVEGSASESATTTYPWMGHLSWTEDIPRDFDRTGLCGATLVAPQWALTAQHCVDSERLKDFRITFDTNAFDGSGGWQVPVTEIVRKPGFQPGPLLNDLALLRLASPAPPRIAPVRLALRQTERDQVHIGTDATIMGWGRWAEAETAGHLRTGTMRINLVDPVYLGARPIERGFGTWTGEGDSGGPILVGDGAELVQVGVVSGSLPSDEQQSAFNRVDPASSNWAWLSSVTGIAGEDAVARPGPESSGQGSAVLRTGSGFWSVTPEGEVTAFGEAETYGSMAGKPLNAPIVAIAGTPTDRGYWLVGSDGGVFAFGDAAFQGSMGGQPLNAPVVGMTATRTGKGYWLVATDGGVFAFGDAEFFGSLGSEAPGSAVMSIQASETGDAYWIITADGRVFEFERP